MIISEPRLDRDKGVEVLRVRSPHLAEPSTIEVLLPDHQVAGQRCRTLYVLPVEPGIGGKYGDGLATVRSTDAHNRYQLICVTMSFDTMPWYGGHATDPGMQHAAFVRDVVELIEGRYATTGRAEDRLLFGFSKSGWGAVSLLLRDPAFFGAAAAWDAPLMMTEQDLAFGSLEHFGCPEQARPFVPRHLVEARADLLRQQPPRLAILGHDAFSLHCQGFHALLESLQIPHHFDNSLCCAHRWDSGWVGPGLEALMQQVVSPTDGTP